MQPTRNKITDEDILEIVVSNQKRMSEMEKLIKNLCEEVSTLRNENRLLKTRVDVLEGKESINQLLPVEDDKMQMNPMEDGNENPSQILNQVQYDQLRGITDPKFSSRKWKLIYRATRDGFEAKVFHRNCDDHSPTLVILKSDKECVFGGYNPVKWNTKDDGYVKTRGTYIFGYEENQTKIVKIPWNGNGLGSIYCGAKYGPYFTGQRGYGFYISLDCRLNSTDLDEKYGYPPPEGKGKFFLNDGKESFKVLDYEVYTLS